MFPSQSKMFILYGLITIVFLNFLIFVFYAEVFMTFENGQYEFSIEERFASKIKSLNYSQKPFIHYPKCEIFNNIDRNNLFLTVLVRSDYKNFQRRVAIRKTWGYNNFFAVNEKVSMKTIFIVGAAKNHIEQMFLDGEFRNFKDLLQMSMDDNYFNKTMVAFKYAVDMCKKTHFFLIVDDDYYVAPRNIARFVTNPLEYPGKFTHIDVGKKLSEITMYAGIVRDEGFVDGAALYSTKALHEIYSTSPRIGRFENVNSFIGKVANIAGIEPVHVADAFQMNSERSSNISFYNNIIAINGFKNEENLTTLWKKSGFKLAKFKF